MFLGTLRAPWLDGSLSFQQLANTILNTDYNNDLEESLSQGIFFHLKFRD